MNSIPPAVLISAAVAIGLFLLSHLGIAIWFASNMNSKVSVVSDGAAKNDESLNTECKVIIWFRNSQAYYDAVKWYSKASTDNFYYARRLDWNNLRDMWTDNFLLSIPFYSGPVSRNSLQYGHCCSPQFGDIKPFIHLSDHSLPFDPLLRRKITKWNEEYNFPILESHTCYYYRKADAIAAMTSKLIQESGSWERPNLNHFSSSEFSVESFLGKSVD